MENLALKKEFWGVPEKRILERRGIQVAKIDTDKKPYVIMWRK